MREKINAGQLLTWFSYLFDALDIGTLSATASIFGFVVLTESIQKN
jgi:hypothetical protein